MKHTTKAAVSPTKTAKYQMIGLRVDDVLMHEIKQLAAAEQRSLADTARICVGIGLKERQALIKKITGK